MGFSLVIRTGTIVMFQGYFDSLRNERLNQSGSGQLAITMLCPGPVFSNVLSESFTETPQQVSIITNHYIFTEYFFVPPQIY